MSGRIIEDVNIKCDKCGKDIKFKVHYDSVKDNEYRKARLDDVEVCSCNGAYKQYVNKYNAMPVLIIK